ncbi:beta-lactamase-like protein [Mycobacteroides abscessus subsp. abscessus]|uniref:MBL fold metallo-hydrolase n=1 Tax=Mycobacteroides abscessus TaxID=36809 RepID=UPI0009280FB8|nr:MBL fold metallo-hydrolase [Mycobacteroides abscessus]SHU53440.1 beta-lactamase-like protein [Mycobacteroides abscessus subsp. abscessus]SHX63462.1 beta-lactamase-like protein [Mycobacteroides abscessus subsp. abscessus]SIG94588.1 beta-lactamase-like protein [Mycobacteroides abscessus subsp. abscessus]SKD19092.1 beta-lactamase-like protein [Mycobacteroides abscessus subsp. abscessus]SKM55964.1 beta-lactamase-like protein [Mycobacteroides abscessus subsp. abscessus]
MGHTPRPRNVTVGHEVVSERIIRVPLPLPLPDLKVVNAYVIVASEGLTLIDPGWSYEPSETALRTTLSTLGAAPSDVRRILVTHQHWDHYSLAIQWRNSFGMELMLGREERHSIEAFTAIEGVHPNQVTMLLRAGAAQLAADIAALQWQPYEIGVPFEPPDRWIDDGDLIDCGSTTLLARSTPGHTRGHTVFHDGAGAAAFTGDHLLPRITPSIAFERAPEALPLRSYISSLRLFLQLPDTQMLPAHGTTDGSTQSRATELLDHHRERLESIATIVCSDPLSAYGVARRLRWTRRRRLLEELDVVHRMTAILEVLAHLDLLVAQRNIAVYETDEGQIFAPA